MKIYYKDKKAFEILIIILGYTQSSLSKKIGKSRPYMNKSLERGIIGADAARKISELFKEPYENLFEVR